MTDTQLSNVVSALNIIYNPQSSNDQRLEAQRYCDSIKSGPTHTLGFSLFTGPYPETIKYYGLDLIQNSIMEVNGQLLLTMLTDSIPCPKYIREKVVVVFVEYVKRNWPLNWTDMDVVLRNMYMNPEYRSIVMAIYKTLADDLFIYEDPVATLRKNELVTSLFAVTLDPVQLGIWLSRIESSMSESKANIEMLVQTLQGDSQNVGWLKRLIAGLGEAADKSMMIGTLSTLTSFSSWTPISAIIESRLVYTMFDMLFSVSDLDIKISCLEVLDAVASRPVVVHEDGSDYSDILIKALFATQYLDQSIKLWAELHGLSLENYKTNQRQVFVEEDEYKVLKSLNNVLVNIGCIHICAKITTGVPDSFNRYLEFMMYQALHPSLTLANNALEFFYLALRHDKISKLLVDPSIMPALLTEFVKENWMPIQAFAWINNEIILYFTNQSSTFSLKSLALGLEDIMQSIPTNLYLGPSVNPSLVEAMGQLLNGILNYDFKDLQQVIHQLPMIVSFSEIVELYPDMLFPCLSKFFYFVTLECPIDQKQDYEDVKYKAAVSLVKLGLKIPNLLSSLLDKIMSYIKDITSKSPVISESKYLIEFLIVIIFGSNLSPQDKQNYLDTILQPYISEFSNVHAMTTTFSMFLESMGLIKVSENIKYLHNDSIDPSLGNELANARANQQRLVRVVVYFANWINRSKEASKKIGNQDYLWQSSLETVVVSVFSIMNNLHTLNSPDTYNYISPELKIITEITLAEKLSALSLELPSTKIVETKPIKLWIAETKSAIGRMHENCNQLVAALSHLSIFFDYPNALGLLNQGLFSNIDFIQLHHWKAILTTPISALILRCPEDHFPLTLQTVIPLFQHLNVKIPLVFQNVELSNTDENPPEDELNAQIINEKFTRLFVRAYSALFGQIFGPSTEVQKNNPNKSTPVFKHPSLVNFYINCPDLAKEWCQSFLVLVTIHDTKTCQAVITILNRIFHIIIKISEYHAFLGTDLLVAALKVVHDGYYASCHTDAFHLVTHIFTNFPQQTLPFTTCASNGIPVDKLMQFEKDLHSATSLKTKHNLVKSFFSSFKGAEVATWGKKEQQFMVNHREKKLLQKPKLETNRSDILLTEESAQLDLLFGQ
ncbi:hypothetical protein HK103_002395 [Boothiomyces macroporosus]|uniref:Uncharacterized protein n=1 Tax=Boothiomyces macroporosus TaxID=261099 RepID=A0AAD5UD71_9FUNG|nr:hypothetical protein HK103_002395 [Boothiomyces macroporosus]